ncbi:MAG: bifunctional metallophosphatase/5'-nucleotidase [Alcanivoracaceae bacterium]|nr:bifunctional metallophosphatase/5'-nucleotidase [Alcanivoracaceae bacterium]
MKAGIREKHPSFFILVVILLSILLTSCHKKNTQSQKSFYILAINDVYRAEGLDNGQIGGLARVKTLRQRLLDVGHKVLLLHAGDFLQPSFSSRVNQGAAMIDIMNQLNGINSGFDEDMIVTFGNHEFDKSKIKYLPRMQQRIDESEFTWMDSNINWLQHEEYGIIHSNKLQKWMIKDIAGIKVGLFSLTTAMTQPQYIASFDDPIEVTKHFVPFLKSKGAEVVIALTHQQISDDRHILNLDLPYRPDLIIGGHEHYRQLEQVQQNWIVKADADAASAAVIKVSIDSKKNIYILPSFEELDKKTEKDPQTQQVIENWLQSTSVKYCQKIKLGENCLDFAYGKTLVELVAEESEIRRYETNMGNFIADTARHEFRLCQADIALINSGSIRLNHNIAAGSNITRKHIEGLFPYPSDLKLITINGKILKKMLAHNIDMWTANGHWLLISGIKYTHNPEQQKFSQLRWSKSDQIITDEEKITAIVPQYLIDAKTDHDGYSMINEAMIKTCNKNGSNLKQLVINSIQNTTDGINPKVDGRICNTLKNNCNK